MWSRRSSPQLRHRPPARAAGHALDSCGERFGKPTQGGAKPQAPTVGDRLARGAVEDVVHEGREVLDRQRRIVGVTRREIPLVDESLGEPVRGAEDVLVPRSPTVPVAELDGGEVLMHAHHRHDLGAHRAGQQVGGDTIVSLRCERLAHVVKEGSDHQLGIGARPLGSRRGLERMLVIVEAQAAILIPQRREERQRDVGTRQTGHAWNVPSSTLIGGHGTRPCGYERRNSPVPSNSTKLAWFVIRRVHVREGTSVVSGVAKPTAGVTVVTGAASGMGLATARRLLRPRETMVLVDLDAAKLDAVRADLAEYAAGQEWVQTAVADVTDADALAGLAEQVHELGPFRALAHAAGVSPTMGEWWQMIHVDLVGTARILQTFLPLAEPGTVAVCWASNSAYIGAVPAGDAVLDAILDHPLAPDLHARLDAALDGRWNTPAGSGEAYGWAKRGVTRLVRREASAWGARGGRLLSISPGIINTPMSRLELERQPLMQVMLDNTPIPRMGAPSEVADLVAFLVSDRAGYLTGTDILIDGGVSATIEGMFNR
jgi:NAD(P)-dependent dehydrogenase (short-subunit alcohol dehydrogenase family)